ncbi:hypothetical protein BKA82DRAFT_2024279 [Pisolithus tinctorius]|nr:hypothetical protein BKA82DRAFT_2024279 [Pisolithus tinctorius]
MPGHIPGNPMWLALPCFALLCCIIFSYFALCPSFYLNRGHMCRLLVLKLRCIANLRSSKCQVLQTCMDFRPLHKRLSPGGAFRSINLQAS